MFQKAHSTQNALFWLLQVMPKEIGKLGKSGYIGTTLMDLFKTNDCLQHDNFIAKVKSYGFNGKGLSLILYYLTSCKQRIQIKYAIRKILDPFSFLLKKLIFAKYFMINTMMRKCIARHARKIC